MVAPTALFSLVMVYTGTHNFFFFFVVMAYIGAQSFVLIPLTTYTLNLNPSHIHIRAWI
jgi:hypothetical protein